MENPAIYEPLRQTIIGCGDPAPTSAIAIWVTGDPRSDALGWLHCINSDDDRRRIAKTLRDHAAMLDPDGSEEGVGELADGDIYRAGDLASDHLINPIGQDGKPLPLRFPKDAPHG